MPRASLIALFLATLFTREAMAASPCGDRLRAFNLYEVRVEGDIQRRHAIFTLPDWSDASAFHGVVADSADFTLEVILNGKKSRFEFAPWDRDPSLFAAEGFKAKKFFENAESGSHFILRLKQDEKTICEESREISGD